MSYSIQLSSEAIKYSALIRVNNELIDLFRLELYKTDPIDLRNVRFHLCYMYHLMYRIFMTEEKEVFLVLFALDQFQPLC